MNSYNLLRLLIACCLLWMLAGCAAFRPVAAPEPEVPQHPLSLAELPQAEPGAGFDSAGVAIKKTTGKETEKKPAPAARKGLFSFLKRGDSEKKPAASTPKKCKNCQITYVVGDNNKVSQASAGKVKAPAVLASDSATQNTAAGNLATVTGDGNQLEQTATTEQAAGFGGAIGKPIGLALAGVIGVGLVWLLVGAIRRRNNNQA